MPLLEVNHLVKAFATVRAVDDVSFRVEPGEIYGLLGPNGAGKTTTLSMICGLLKPEAGDVTVDGSSFWGDPRRAQRIMGVVPQEVALYEELTGRENLEFWGRMAGLEAATAKARTGELLEALLLTDRARDTVKKYSGGMKRRINLGVALMHRPRMLLLDEPTVGIDPQARANILEFIRRLCAEGTGILYTTHYLEEAEQLCQRIGIIDLPRARWGNSRNGSAAIACLSSKAISPARRPRGGRAFAKVSASCSRRIASSSWRRSAIATRPSACATCWPSPSMRRTSPSSGPA